MDGQMPGGDRNMLYGILALQCGFIGRDELIAAMNDWVLEKQTPLSEVLKRRGYLEPEVGALLDALVRKQLDKHNGDLAASIAALSSVTSLQAALSSFSDELVQATLQTIRGFDADAPTGQGNSTILHRGPDAKHSDASNGRFRILKPHARGGLGEVFIAEDAELHREVALKELQEEQADNAESRNRFVLEAEITGNLEHPGIVPVYGLGTYGNGRPFYAMRFIRGDSLKVAIEKFHQRADFDSLAFRMLLRRFVDVCNAIAYAHSRGVLHRDIKPGNVMLGKYGETLVVDWGMAKALQTRRETPGIEASDDHIEPTLRPRSASGSTATEAGQVFGTPAYMSPEQASGKVDELGIATDVYSLGALLYTLLTNQLPFRGPGREILAAVIAGKLDAPTKRLPSVPKALEATCLKAMRLEPSMRYATALDLAADVEHWLGDEPVGAYAEPRAAQIRRWFRKHPGRAGGLLSALAVGLLSTAVGLAIVDRQRQTLALKNRELDESLERESAARKAAQENEALAQANRLKADAEFRRAKKAIDEYFTDVSESNELRTKFPGMQTFRQKLLEKAAIYYDEFLKNHGNDPSLRYDAAMASVRKANIALELGQNEIADKSFGLAVARLQRLVADDPASARNKVELAKALGNHAALQLNLGHPRDALAYWEKGHSIFEELARSNPESGEYMSLLGHSFNNQATSQYALRNLRASLANHDKARAVREKNAKANPKNLRYANDLAMSYHNIAATQRDLGSLDVALENYQKAIDIRERILKASPDSAPAMAALGLSLQNIGNLLRAMKRIDESLVMQQRALQLFERLVRENPSVLDYAVQLGGCYCNLGTLVRDSVSWSKSLQWFDKSIATLAEPAKRSVFAKRYLRNAHWGRAHAFGQLTRDAEALVEIDRALQLDDGEARSELLKLQKAVRINLAIESKRATDAKKAKSSK